MYIISLAALSDLFVHMTMNDRGGENVLFKNMHEKRHYSLFRGLSN